MRFNILVAKHGSVRKAYEATIKDFDPNRVLDELQKKDISVLTREDKRFPPQLLNIPDPPICLYVKGDASSFSWEKGLFIGVVGTRKPTSYGIQAAKKLSQELVFAGSVVVSGMAVGIDTVAHQSALESGGRTIAVLGCGVDIIYPPQNKNLYQEIIKSRGLIISEFPPGMTTLKGLFVARNRLISGISAGVLVVEGAKDSGALITARCAAEQGKEVFATPGPITSSVSEGPHILLKEGAKLVTTSVDILEEFGYRGGGPSQKQPKIDLIGDEKLIFDLLSVESMLIDEIIAKIQKPANFVLNTLTMLEVKKIVEKNHEGKYQQRI